MIPLLSAVVNIADSQGKSRDLIFQVSLLYGCLTNNGTLGEGMIIREKNKIVCRKYKSFISRLWKNDRS